MLAYFLILYSLSIAYCINMSFFLIMGLINFVAFLYSNQPFRLKKHIFLSYFTLGFIALFTFYLGVAVYMEQLFFKYTPLFLSLTIFFSISVISQIKDIKDFSGDRQFGINNFMTLTNFNTGKNIISIQILIIALIIPIYYRFYDLLIFSILTSSILMFLLIYKKFFEKLLFFLYFVFITWFFMRIFFSNYLLI